MEKTKALIIMNGLHRFVIITAIFVTCSIIANIVAVKPIGFYRLPAAIVIFPLSYIFGDILTEVNGLLLGKKGNLAGLKKGV